MASTKKPESSHSPSVVSKADDEKEEETSEGDASSAFFTSIRDEVQALPTGSVPISATPGAYNELGRPRLSPAPIGDVEVAMMQAEDADTLVQAELAPDNFEEIVAERDALRQIMNSVQAATEVVPHAENGSDNDTIQEGGAMTKDTNQSTNQQQKLKPWHILAIICILAALVGVILGVTLSGKDDNSSSSSSFWQPRKIGQTLLGAEPYDEFGEYLSLSSDGSLMAVGGEEHGDFAGRVVVYQNNDKQGDWNQLFQILGDVPGEESGRVVLSSDASMLAISGIRATNGQQDEKAGRVRTFQLSLQEANQPDQSPETYYHRIPQVLEGSHQANNYGGNVQFSADGTIMSVGSHGSRPQNANGTEFGGVEVFQFDSGTGRWQRLGQELLGDYEGDYFGSFTALSADGLVLAAGGYGSDANGDRSGILRVYRFDEETMVWKQLGQTFYGEDAGDEVGRSISLSSDGQTLAFGGYRHNDDAGRVYVYKWSDDSAAWQLMGQPIDGVNPSDRLGRSVFLSGDGLVLAAGAYWNSEVGDRAGHVRVFHWNRSDNETWEQVGPPICGTEGAWFGRRIAMSRDGTTLAIGGPFHDSVNGVEAGMVEVYSLPDFPAPA